MVHGALLNFYANIKKCVAKLAGYCSESLMFTGAVTIGNCLMTIVKVVFQTFLGFSEMFKNKQVDAGNDTFFK